MTVQKKSLHIVLSGYFSDKPSSWMTVDTALFAMSAGETKEDSTLVCFTESKDKEVCLCVLRDVHDTHCTIGFVHVLCQSFPMTNLRVCLLIQN